METTIVRTMACALILGACFSDTGGSAAGGSTTDSTISESTSSQGESSTTASDDLPTASTTDTGESGSGGDTTTEGVTTSGTSTGSGSGSDDCAPVDVEVDGVFEAGETRTLYLDFDGFPGVPGEEFEICMTFTTTNYASARTVTIGGPEGEWHAFGPCGPLQPDPGPFTLCAPFVKLEGLVEVIIDNSTFGPGCQTGPMDDLVLRFGCL